MATTPNQPSSDPVCRHCGEALFRTSADQPWNTVYRVTLDGTQCPRPDLGIMVNDGHEPESEDRTTCYCASGHRCYDYDAKRVWVECDECGAVFTNADNTGGLAPHPKPEPESQEA